jgi:hypothetical protein
LQQQFDDLSSLLSPECLVKADYTQLRRGLVAKEDIAKGTRVLSIDVFNLLCVTDEPLRTNAFGSAALSDWQMLHGDLPPQLAAYLLSSELQRPPLSEVTCLSRYSSCRLLRRYYAR